MTIELFEQRKDKNKGRKASIGPFNKTKNNTNIEVSSTGNKIKNLWHGIEQFYPTNPNDYFTGTEQMLTHYWKTIILVEIIERPLAIIITNEHN